MSPSLIFFKSVISFTFHRKYVSINKRIIWLSDYQIHRLSEIITLGENILTLDVPPQFRCGMVARGSASSHSLTRFAGLLELFLLDLHENLHRSSDTTSKIANSFDKRFLFLVEYLKEHISENLSLSEISHSCSTSISALHRLCKKQCGTSPLSLFISLKIARAKQLISETDMNFSKISDTLGFSSIHYFSRLFKSRTGMSPSEYSKNTT